MNDQYANEFDKPWDVHPDVDTPINDLKPRTFVGANEALGESFKQLIYQLSKNLGLLWIISKTPFLETRQWVKDIERPF